MHPCARSPALLGSNLDEEEVLLLKCLEDVQQLLWVGEVHGEVLATRREGLSLEVGHGRKQLVGHQDSRLTLALLLRLKHISKEAPVDVF